MHLSKTNTFGLCVILAGWLIGPAFGATADLRVKDGFAILKDVFVDGRGPYRFLLDTGSDSCVIDPKLAAEIGFIPSHRVEVASVGGDRFIVGGFGTFTIAGESAEKVEVLVYDLNRMRRTDSKIRGVIGQSLLSRFNYTLDLDQKELRLGDDPSASGEGWERVDLQRYSGRPGVILQSGTSLVIDSGASHLILFSEGEEKMGKQVMRSGNAQLLSSASSVSASLAKLLRIRVGNGVLADVDAALLGQSARASGREEDGLLPARLFRAVHVNNRDGYVGLLMPDSQVATR